MSERTAGSGSTADDLEPQPEPDDDTGEAPPSTAPDARDSAFSRWRRKRREKPKATGFKAWLKELPILLAIAFVLALLIKTFIVQAFFVPSGSMETTLHGCPGCTGDRILVNKMSYLFSDPQPGDIIVFKGEDDWAPEFSYPEPTNPFGQAWLWLQRSVGAAPPDEKDFVKRVIAVGGQTVMCCDSKQRVVVDGKPLDEPYIYISPEGGADPSTYQQQAFGPITVPAGRLFVMGDHRNNSADSRAHLTNQYQGTVAVDSVVGRAFVIVWPFARFDWLSAPDIQASAPLGIVALPPAGGLLLATPLAAARVRRRRRQMTRRRRGPPT